jgi:hypothetical protein
MNITALSSQLQPVTNKRNSALLGKAIEESLGVSPNRGIIRFIPIAEENYATDGKTLAGEIEEFERERMDDPSALYRGLSRASGKGRKRSLKSLRELKSNSHLYPRHEAITPPSSGMLHIRFLRYLLRLWLKVSTIGQRKRFKEWEDERALLPHYLADNGSLHKEYISQ